MKRNQMLGILVVAVMVVMLVSGVVLAAPGEQLSNPLEQTFNAPMASITVGAGLPYETIGAALTDIAAGGTITVNAGNYTLGQVVIDKNVTIKAADGAIVTVTPTSNTGSVDDARGWILTKSSTEVTIQGITLDGSGYDVHQAIRANGNLALSDTVIQNIKYPGYGGIGVALYGAGTIQRSTFNNIGRIGVFVYGQPGIRRTVENNTYTGKGEGDWLDYAVEVGGGGNALITNNTLTACKGVAASDNSQSAGILVTTYYAEGTTAEIKFNSINNNTSGVTVGYDDKDSSVVTINDNDLSNNGTGVESTNAKVDATRNYWGSDLTNAATGLVAKYPWAIATNRGADNRFTTLTSAQKPVELSWNASILAQTMKPLNKPFNITINSAFTDNMTVADLPNNVALVMEFGSGTTVDGATQITGQPGKYIVEDYTSGFTAGSKTVSVTFTGPGPQTISAYLMEQQ